MTENSGKGMSEHIHSHQKQSLLPERFRKLPLLERRQLLARHFGFPLEESDTERRELIQLADVMVESAVGYLSVPLGIATGFLIDDVWRYVPMATEEPSVIAAASYAAGIIAGSGGFTTWADTPIMGAQIFIESVAETGLRRLQEKRDHIQNTLDHLLSSFKRRGGGVRNIEMRRLPETNVLCVEFFTDVRDAMGANGLNTAAEKIAPLLERISGGITLMAILTNAAEQRLAGARFRLPLDRVPSSNHKAPREVARRIALASAVALEDSRRAVTGNKGMMNGISALALATGNDTRGLEAAVHAYAAQGGSYRSLARYSIEGEYLIGHIELPVPLGTVGGAIGLHPASAAALRILDIRESSELARIAAALGLAQSFAALLALVTSGIQRGHMRLHALRMAWKAGARGSEIARVAQIAYRKSLSNIESIRLLLAEIRARPSGTHA